MRYVIELIDRLGGHSLKALPKTCATIQPKFHQISQLQLNPQQLWRMEKTTPAPCHLRHQVLRNPDKHVYSSRLGCNIFFILCSQCTTVLWNVWSTTRGTTCKKLTLVSFHKSTKSSQGSSNGFHDVTWRTFERLNKTGCCFYDVTSELQEKHENITRKVDTLKMYIKKISSLTLEDLADKLVGRVRSFVEENMSGKLEYLNVSS